jgi:hypothetical protein
MSTDLVEGWILVANHVHHSFLREGARCYPGHWGGLDRLSVYVAPKGRRWAEFWTRPDRLYDLRVMRHCAPRGSTLSFLIRAKKEDHAERLAGLVARGAKLPVVEVVREDDGDPA